MNRTAIAESAPGAAGWHALPPATQKAATQDVIADTLDAIEHEDHREPDDWEAMDICAAMNAIHMGWYSAAINYALMALTPPEQRAGDWARKDTTPSLAHLRAGLDYACAAPARAP